MKYTPSANSLANLARNKPLSPGEGTTTLSIRVPESWMPQIEARVSEECQQKGLTPQEVYRELFKRIFLNGVIPAPLPKTEKPKVVKLERAEPQPKIKKQALITAKTPVGKPLEIVAIKSANTATIELKPAIETPSAPKIDYPDWREPYRYELELFDEVCAAQTKGMVLFDRERIFCPIDYPNLNAQVTRVHLDRGWIECMEVGFTRSLLSASKEPTNLGWKRSKVVPTTHKDFVKALDKYERPQYIFSDFEYDLEFVKRWEKEGFDIKSLRNVIFGDGKEDLNESTKHQWVLDIFNKFGTVLEGKGIDNRDSPVLVDIGDKAVNTGMLFAYQSFAQSNCEFDPYEEEWVGDEIGLKAISLYHAFWLCMPSKIMSQEKRRILLNKLDPDDYYLLEASRCQLGNLNYD